MKQPTATGGSIRRIRPAVLLSLALALASPASARVSFDAQSLLIDGRRVVLNSGEVHYARMPDPREWPDVLARVKADGFNAISIYVPWMYHEPAPGRFRFAGRYDLERFLADARDAGLWVVVRPGPYVNGEMDGGGFPAWLLGRPGMLRTTDPAYTATWKAWYRAVLPRVARWQFGGPRRGTVVAVQVENEYPGDGAEAEAYLRDLVGQARALGITVPILHNDQTVFASPGRFADIVDLYGVDSYPYGFSCCPAWGAQTLAPLDDLEPLYRQHGAERSPLYLPEVQGGIAPIGGDDGATPQARYRALEGYATVQQLSLLGQGVTMANQYMLFGGTTWGYTPYPNLGSSYDYAAPIREWTGLGPRYQEERRLGLQIAAAGPSLAATHAVFDAVSSDDPSALYRVRRSDVDGALHIFLRNADPGPARAPTLAIEGRLTPPVPLPGHSARYLLADASVAGWRIGWSTAEVALARRRTLVLFGDRGQEYAAEIDGRVVRFRVGRPRALRFPDRPVRFRGGRLRLAASSGGRRVLILDRAAAARTWVWRGRVIVGPALVTPRGAELDRRTTLTVLDARGRLRHTRLPGPPGRRSLHLPVLRRWRFARESREREPGYDDRGWTRADRQTTTNNVQPLTRPVLDADAYGQPTGYVWYRGRFSGRAAGVCLEGRHRYHVWLNGHSLGTATSAADSPGPNGLGGTGGLPSTHQNVRIAFPADAVRGGVNVLAVLTDDWGHNEDFTASNFAKQPRGLWSAALDRGGGARCGFELGGESGVRFGERGTTQPPVAAPDGGIAWRLRGGRPRDYPNASGLSGERDGWYRRGFDDRRWRRVALPDRGRLGAGEVGWYRTTFRVRLPRGTRAPLGLSYPAAGQPAEIFLNGVHIARAGRDRATRFVLPPGLVRTGGRPNTLAIARWAVSGARVPRPRLLAYEVTRRLSPGRLNDAVQRAR